MAKMHWSEVTEALPTLMPAKHGTSNALRGVLKLSDDRTVFVKIATDQHTHDSIRAELNAYSALSDAGYGHIPVLLAQSDEGSGFALQDLSGWDWSSAWTTDRLDAALQALDDLANLDTPKAAFAPSFYSPKSRSPWRHLPDTAEAYEGIVSQEVVKRVAAILTDRRRVSRYAQATDHQSWRGDELVHYDARADNFAYDPVSGNGYFVDWNWAGLGSRRFDQTALLVTAAVAGYDVLQRYYQRLDRDSLLWLAGFWLERGLGPQDTAGRQRLRPLQVINGLAAEQLFAEL